MSIRINRKSKIPRSNQPGFRTKKLSGVSRAVGFLFGLPFLGMGLFFLWIGAGQTLFMIYQSKDWPEVPCVVSLSKVERVSSSDGDTYKVNIQFRYSYEGRQYQGGSYDFSVGSSGGDTSKQKIVDQYPVGFETTCWLDPQEPTTAVLSRRIPGMVYFMIPFTSIFIVIGAVIMLSSLGLMPSEWSNRFRRSHKRVDSPDSGMQQLKPEFGGGFGKFFLILVVAIFWNGIVSIPVRQVIDGFKEGDPEWFMTLFMIPFVCVGIGMIIAVFYSLLALKNPKFMIRLSEGSPRLGDTVRLEWETDGSLKPLINFRFYLEGKEAATYQRGTNSVTDTCIFHRDLVFETQTPAMHGTGSIELSIPLHTMHTLDCKNNKIKWQLRAEGKIRKWPDVKATYPFTVRPVKLN